MVRLTMIATLLTALASAPAASPQTHAGPNGTKATEYTFRVCDDFDFAWLEGVLVSISPQDGSAAPGDQVTNARGEATFKLSSAPGTMLNVQMSAPGYCPLSETVAVPDKRGKGLALQFAITRCAA